MKKAVAGLATVGALFALAPAADAANLGTKKGFTYVKASETLTGTGATQAQDVEAVCPAGSNAASGGSAVSGPPATAFLSSATSVSERQWYTDAWHSSAAAAKVTSWAICTEKKDDLVDSTEAESTDPAPSSATEVALCDSGTVLAGGVRSVGDTDDYWINTLNPIDDVADADLTTDDGARAWLWHREGNGGTMITDAFCMTGIEPQYRQSQRTTADAIVKLQTKCGKRTAIGGGAFATGSAANAHVVKSAPRDGGDKDKAPDDGWSVTYANDAAPAQGTFTAYTVCL